MARLISLIDRTYVGTLDCPCIDGLRRTADVIAGYQAVGQYRPELWFVVHEADQEAGCLLLNIHPGVGHLEIIYLAVVPPARGRGWGLELARLARRLAAEHDCSRVVLAVDSANAPAIRMYEQAGFTTFDRRCVWFRTLAKN
jgi:ribosomal protein S18 acetylase RimI-like enzyme